MPTSVTCTDGVRTPREARATTSHYRNTTDGFRDDTLHARDDTYDARDEAQSARETTNGYPLNAQNSMGTPQPSIETTLATSETKRRRPKHDADILQFRRRASATRPRPQPGTRRCRDQRLGEVVFTVNGKRSPRSTHRELPVAGDIGVQQNI